MKKISIFLFLSVFLNINLFAQKIDTDSLLVKTWYEVNTSKNYAKAIDLAKLGIEKAPDYLDFYEVLGRCYMLTHQIESSRTSLNYVINKDPKYKDSFIYLSKLEIEEKNASNALIVINRALVYYPEEKDFYILKLKAINLENNDDKSISFLNSLTNKYPSDTDLRQQLREMKMISSSDRIGINYNYTTFDRNGIGPWHLLGLQYARERKKITLISRINYTDRRASGSTVISGTQYEIETYLRDNKKNYSFANLSFSNDIVFPKLRLSYSFYKNFAKGWESEIGMRYNKTADKNLYTGVIGIGKYIGSYWLNLKSYLQTENSKTYPAFTATARYYFDTKYDYATIIAGYGSSPDERVYLGQLQQSISLNSFRIGLGYYRLISTHYCVGAQTSLNHQEYSANLFQNEFDTFLSLQYKF